MFPADVPDCTRVEEVTTSEEEVTTMVETHVEMNSTSCPNTSDKSIQVAVVEESSIGLH